MALYRNVVFIDGRVACRASDALDFTQIARDVYADAGFGKVLDTTTQPKSTARGNAARPRYLPYQFDPSPKKLRVVTELCLGDLHIGEGEFREVADDQSIITGYACSLPGTDGLPVEHALVRTLAWQLDQLRKCEPELQLGPDGKLIVFVEESEGGRKFRLQSVSISIQHAASWNAVEARRAIERCVNDALHAFALRVPGFDVGDFTQPEINAAGEFIGGGPYGDNGLSGKKLVADFYGARVSATARRSGEPASARCAAIERTRRHASCEHVELDRLVRRIDQCRAVGALRTTSTAARKLACEESIDPARYCCRFPSHSLSIAGTSLMTIRPSVMPSASIVPAGTSSAKLTGRFDEYCFSRF